MRLIRLPAVALGAAILATGTAHATMISGTGAFADNGPANNGLTFAGITNNSEITNLNLSLNTPVTLSDFLTISTTDTAWKFFGSTHGTDSIAEGFNFTLPSSASGSLTGSGSEKVGYFFGLVDSVSGNVTWNNPLSIDFTDGAVLQIALSDARFNVQSTFWNVASPSQSVGVNATLDLIQGPTVQGGPPGTAVSEPGTLALMAAGFLGLSIVRRRRKSV